MTDLQNDPHDEELFERITNRLCRTNYPSLRAMTVTVRDGVVLLQGQVNSFYERQLCLESCTRLPQVRQVIDELQVVQYELGN
jgi:osmotically-inducible protein OsmY